MAIPLAFTLGGPMGMLETLSSLAFEDTVNVTGGDAGVQFPLSVIKKTMA